MSFLPARSLRRKSSQQQSTRHLFLRGQLTIEALEDRSLMAVVVGEGSASMTMHEGAAAAIYEFDSYFDATTTRAQTLSQAAPGNASFAESPQDPSTGTVTVSDPIRPFGELPLNDAGGTTTGTPGQSRTRQATTLHIENLNDVLGSWSTSNDASAFVGNSALGEQIAFTNMQRWTGPFTGSLVYGDFALRYTGSKLVLASNIDFLGAAFADIGNPVISVSGNTLTIQGDLLMGGGLALLDPNAVPGTDFGDITITAMLSTPPTVTDVANQTTDEDTPTTAIPFTIGDVETAPDELIVTATSSNTALVPNGNIALGGSGANRTVAFTPASNLSGTTTITLAVTDAAGVRTIDTFELTVNSVNDIPTISDVANQTTGEDTPTGAIAFTIGDVETAPGELIVTATSSNTALVPNGNIALGGSGTNRTVAFTPAANQHGTTTITLTVTDAGGLQATDTIVLTVNPVYDPPVAVGTGSASITLNEGFATAIAEFDAYFSAGKTRAETLSDPAPGDALFNESPSDPATGTATLSDPIRPFGLLPLNDAGGTSPGTPGLSRTRQATTLQIEDVSDVLGSWSTSNDDLAYVGNTNLGEQIAFTGMQRWTNPFTGALLFGDFALRYTGSKFALTSNIDFLGADFADIGNPIISVSGNTLTIQGDLLIGGGLALIDPSAVPGTDFGDITISATLGTPPVVTDPNISISGATGTGGVFRIGDTVTATWNNTVAGDNNSAITSATVDFSQFGGGSAVAATNNNDTWTASYTIVTGNIDATGRNVSVTATSSVGTTTSDTTNATVDNVAPTVSDARVSIGGATGTGGAFKIGDTVTATWNNTTTGDNNSEVSAVTVDFSQFGGGSAVVATNTNGTWAATYTIVAGTLNDVVNRNVSVKATDDVGNSTTTTDSTNARLDNVAPTIVSINRADANPTNASTVHYTVTFSEPVTGASAADFALATSGVSGTTITSVALPAGAGTVLPNTTADGTTYLTYNREAWATVAPYADFLDIHGAPLGSGANTADADGFRWMFPDRFEGASWVRALYPADYLTAPLPDYPLNLPSGGFAMAVNTYGVNSFTPRHKISDYNSTTNPNGYIGLAGSLRVTSDFNEPGASIWWEHLAVRQDPIDSIWKIEATSGAGRGSVFELRNVSTETVNGNLHLSGDYVFGNTDWFQFLQSGGNGILDPELVLGHIDIVPSSTTYTVTVNTGAGTGTLGMDLNDDDSIKDSSGNVLGGSGNGFFAGQVYTIMNTAPVAEDSSVTAIEDVVFTGFSTGSFAFTDLESNPLSSITISTLSLNGGTLNLSGLPVAINQTITAAQISSLTYTSAMNQNGTGIASFGFTVNDANANGTVAAVMTINVTAVNDAPTITSDLGGATAAISAAEKQWAVTTVTATDPESEQTLTYSITGGTDAAKFSITSGGVLTFVAAPDFEVPTDVDTNNVYEVTVQVADGIGGIDTQQLSVTVTDVIEVTTLQVTSLTVGTSSFAVRFTEALNTSVLNLVDSNGVNGPSDITITGATSGVVKGSVVLDADSKGFTFIKTGGVLAADTYTVSLRSAANGFVTPTSGLLDGDGNGTTGDDYSSAPIVVSAIAPETITLGVGDFVRGYGQAVNLPATSTAGIPISLSTGLNVASTSFTLTYNPALLTIMGGTTPIAGATLLVDTTTPGQAVVTLSNGGNQFSATGSPLTIVNLTAVIPDTAPNGSKGVLDLNTVSVTSVDSSPLTIIADDGIEVAAYRGDLNNSRTITTGDVTGLLRSISGALSTTGFPNLKLADPALVGDMNDSGTLTTGDATGLLRFISGNAGSFPQIPALPTGITAPAPGADPEIFIDQNLTVAAGNSIVVPIKINVTESTGASVGGFDVTFSYDADRFDFDSVTLGSALDGFSFSSGNNTSVPGLARFTYAADVGPSFDNGFTGVLLNVTLTAKATAAPGSSALNLTAAGASDNNTDDLLIAPAITTGTDASDGIITVQGVTNHAPTITTNGGGASATINVAENTTAVTDVDATDADLLDILAYNLSGVDASKFALTSGGVLSFLTAPNFEAPTDAGADNIYNVTITVDDGHGGTDTQDLAITVTNVAPAIANQTFNLYKAAKLGAVIGTVVATEGATSYEITAGNTSNAIAINPTTGALTTAITDKVLKTLTGPLTLTVKATDAAGLFSTGTVTINLNLTNAIPTYTVVNSSNFPVVSADGKTFGVTLNENVPNGTLVGKVTVSDTDPGSSLTTVFTDKTGAFSYNSANGEVRVVDSSKLNFEKTKAFKLAFATSDNGIPGLAKIAVAKTTLVVTMADVNEVPTIAAGPTATVTVNENKAGKLAVKAVDPDKKQTPKSALTYTVASQTDSTGAPVTLFAVVDPAKGTVTFPALNYEASPFYTVVVRATDNGSPNLFVEQTITVNVTDLNEAAGIVLKNPANATVTSLSVTKASVLTGDVIGSILVTDPDAATPANVATTGKVNVTVVDGSKGGLVYDSLTRTIKIGDKAKLVVGKTYALTVTDLDSSTAPVKAVAKFSVTIA